MALSDNEQNMSETRSCVCVCVCLHPIHPGRQSALFGISWAHQPGAHRRKINTDETIVFAPLFCGACLDAYSIAKWLEPSLSLIDFVGAEYRVPVAYGGKPIVKRDARFLPKISMESEDVHGFP